MAATTRRKSAEERREEILAIAIEHCTADGFRGTPTAVIARGRRGRAARRAPAAMEHAYTNELLPDRHAVLMSMHGFAAAGVDPEIRATVRRSSARS